MANICDTTYKITGTRKAVIELWNAIRMFDVDSMNVRLSKLAEYFGIDWKNRHICVRGSIYFAEYECDEAADYYVLTIETETAWSACNQLFETINKEILSGELSISYREIECGCDIYCVHDEGSFFEEECCVSSSGEPFEDACDDIYDTIDDAINEWCEKMNFDRGGRTREDMMEYIDGYEYDNPDTYFCIHPFEFE